MPQPRSVTFPARESRRKYERSAVSLNGHLFMPAEESQQPCQIVDLSPGSARVTCEDVPPVATYVILYIDGFGRFPAVTTRYSDGAIGMRFNLTASRRDKLTAQIKAYVTDGITGVTALRRVRRAPAPATGAFERAGGEEIACTIRDFTLDGAFLETECRPPLGEAISLGPYQGSVVRHEESGIAIQFAAARGGEAVKAGEN